MAHVQRKCSRCRRSVPPGARGCPACGSREARWVARSVGPDRRERSRSFTRKVDAEAYLAAQETKKSTGEWTDPALGRETLAGFYAEWLADATDTNDPAPSTRAKYDGCGVCTLSLVSAATRCPELRGRTFAEL